MALQTNSVNVFDDSDDESNEPYDVMYYSNEIVASKYSILRINVKSLKNKLDDLELFVHNQKKRNDIEFYILVLTEINIFKEDSKYYNLPSYNAYFSTNESGEGGVALYIHRSLTSGVIEKLENDQINCIIANIPDLKIHVGVLNSHPNTTTESILRYYKKILRKTKETILFCDTNVNLLDSNASTTRYINAIKNNQYSVLNKISRDSGTRSVRQRYNGSLFYFSSHSTTHAEPIIVDHVISNIKWFRYSLSLFKTPTTVSKLSRNRIMILGFDDKAQFKIPFIAESSMVECKKVVESRYNRFFRRINFGRIDSIGKLVSMLNRCKDRSIKNFQIPRRICDRSWLDRPRQSSILRANEYARIINNCSQEDAKRFLETINGVLMNKPFARQTVDAIYNRNHEMITEKYEIVDILNDYFLKIGQILYNKIPQMKNISIPEVEFRENSICCIHVTPNEIHEMIHMMKKNNSLYDYAPTKFLKKYSRLLAPVLAEQFNNCIHNRFYPYELKIDRIVPAFKKDDPLNPKNYRPISVVSNLCKLFEMRISKSITEFCLDNNIINRNQYGFQKKSSSLSAVISIVNYLQIGISACRAKGMDAIGACLFIDLEKASNTIPHDILLYKLYRYGVRDELHEVLRDYLHERRQYVEIDHHLSQEKTNYVGFSIPQGSALGPLFFLLFINDIFQLKLHGKLILYADDTAIVYVETDPDDLRVKMEHDIKLLNRWFTANSLSLNATKTKAMLFNDGNVPCELNLKIRNKKIDFVETHSYLGVLIQNNLKWDAHIDKIIRELNAAADGARKIGTLKKSAALLMYNSHVFNRLLPMASVYGCFANNIDLMKLQEAQDNAVSSIFSGHFENILDLYAEYRLLKVHQIIDYDLVLLAYKLENNLQKLDLTVDSRYSYIDTRNVVNVAYRKFAKLDPSIQNEPSLIKFKRKFKRHCIDNLRYTLS